MFINALPYVSAALSTINNLPVVPVMLTAPPLCLSQISGCKAKPYKPPGRAHYLLLYQHQTNKKIYRTYTVNSNMLHLMEGWNGIKVQTYIFRQTRKKFCLLFFFVFSFTCNKLFYWHRQWIHLVGAGPSCTPARICSSCWCVRICLQYDSEVTSHLMVELVACSMTNQDLICFFKKMFCCCMYMSGGNVLKNLGDVDKVESMGGRM